MWSQPIRVALFSDRVTYKAKRFANGISVRFVSCPIYGIYLGLLATMNCLKVEFQDCSIQYSFKVDGGGYVKLKIANSQIKNAQIQVSAKPGMWFPEVVLNDITSKNTSIQVIRVPSLSISYSWFKDLYVKVEGYAKFATMNVDNSHFEDNNPSEGQSARETRMSCISNQTHFFRLKEVALEVKKSSFKMNCILQRGFIEWEYTYKTQQDKLTVTDTVFDAENMAITLPLIATPFGVESIHMKNVTLKCKTQAKHQRIGIAWELQCIENCDRGFYRANRQLAIVSMNTIKRDQKTKLKRDFKRRTCVQCPVGADCNEKQPSPLPNYWGYYHKAKIRMVRCPEEYCCAGGENCRSLTSCAAGRIGKVCGQCKTNTTESLFSAACVSVDKCKTALVVIFYILAALGYALFLLLFNQVKKVVFKKLKELWKLLKGFRGSGKKTGDHFELAELWTKEVQLQLQQKKKSHVHEARKCRSLESLDLRPKPGAAYGGNLTTLEENTDAEKPEKKEEKDSGMKYLQILFYFVQDAALFKVHLPDFTPKEKSMLVRFLEFSPQVLLLYTEVTSLCIISDTTAVLKVTLKALFGPCIMALLFLMYLGQRLLSGFVLRNSTTWETVKAKLCEAFLLTILFSYQKIIQSCFRLVQCIEIKDAKVLFIQAEIVCFTWWQTTIETYLSLATVPVFIFLSLGPYFVKDKRLSVQLFLVACFFPLPLLLYLVVLMIRQKCRCLSASRPVKKHLPVHIRPIKEVEYTSTEEALMETLLKHYKTLNICGVRLTWLVFLKLYRMALVWCSTYITEPFPRLCGMTVLVLLITVVVAFVKPYKDKMANQVAFLSYIASLSIAFINMAKSALISGIYQPTPLITSVTQYLNVFDSILLTWLPVLAIALWVLYSIMNLIRPKDDGKDDAKTT